MRFWGPAGWVLLFVDGGSAALSEAQVFYFHIIIPPGRSSLFICLICKDGLLAYQWRSLAVGKRCSGALTNTSNVTLSACKVYSLIKP